MFIVCNAQPTIKSCWLSDDCSVRHILARQSVVPVFLVVLSTSCLLHIKMKQLQKKFEDHKIKHQNYRYVKVTRE